MTNPSQVLIHRVGIKKETVKTGLFSHETRISIDGTIDEGELLFRILNDDADGNAAAEKVDKDQLPDDPRLRLFAVQGDPFELALAIDLGQERDGFHWYLRLGGDAKVVNRQNFLARYYSKAKEAPFTAECFVEAMGTRPANHLLDEILLKSMQVLALDDINVDVAQWAKERNLTEDAFTNALREKKGTPFGNGEVEFTVNSVCFSSPERDRAIEESRRKIAVEEAAAINKAKEQENADRIAREKEAERAEQIAEEKHQLELAKLRKQRDELAGPRPEIKITPRVVSREGGYMTRDLVPVTSSLYSSNAGQKRPSAHPANRLAIGETVEFELTPSIDGWLHVYNYGTSGRVTSLVPSEYSTLADGRIRAGRKYIAGYGGDMITVPLMENGPTTSQTGRLERFIAIITKYPVDISTASVKELFDKRNPGSGVLARGFGGGVATRGGFAAVEEAGVAAEEPLEEAFASLLDIPPEDWVQATIELEVV